MWHVQISASGKGPGAQIRPRCRMQHPAPVLGSFARCHFLLTHGFSVAQGLSQRSKDVVADSLLTAAGGTEPSMKLCPVAFDAALPEQPKTGQSLGQLKADKWLRKSRTAERAVTQVKDHLASVRGTSISIPIG